MVHVLHLYCALSMNDEQVGFVIICMYQPLIRLFKSHRELFVEIDDFYENVTLI